MQEPQSGLLRYVLEQPYSRDMVGSMLGLNKQVNQVAQVNGSFGMQFVVFHTNPEIKQSILLLYMPFIFSVTDAYKSTVKTR